MSSAVSPASTLHQMARLADELEAQGAKIISASLSNCSGSYLQLSEFDLPASIAERGKRRLRTGQYDEIYIDASGVRVCWLVDKETSHD